MRDATWRDLFRLAPAPGSGRTAVRALVVMAVGLISVRAVGRLDWSLYVTFGAFASVYGAGLPHRGRPAPPGWHRQLLLGALLTTAVTLGVAVGISDHRSWWSIPVAAAVAAGAAWLSDRFSWKPSGPMFLVFAVAACSSVPAEPENLVAALSVAGATALLAVAVGAAEERWWPQSPSTHGSATTSLSSRSSARSSVTPKTRPGLQAVRCAAAVVLAGVCATATGLGHPYWAMVAAVVPLGVFGLHQQLLRGVHRAIGTLIGLGVAAALLVASLPDLVLLLLVAVLQGLTELFVARNYGLALVFVTPLALLLGEVADPQPVAELLTERLGQTVLGLAVGMIVAVLTRRRS